MRRTVRDTLPPNIRLNRVGGPTRVNSEKPNIVIEGNEFKKLESEPAPVHRRLMQRSRPSESLTNFIQSFIDAEYAVTITENIIEDIETTDADSCSRLQGQLMW